ncbi:hypothetical protein Rleg2_1142 [Rhizobium leguminosarum bv. trifolii WSM2304]|uniref:DUF5681 domain-containing protein n=1 Tax=Rhizobium leguminosarum bv. trifolii (strain WSM2304) TaxID=395492 RepID=A0ABF7QKB6_RHILW|nr:hypothetical protein [Rhizobium leguminosarum]ACI54436.1 hypothetical protein Rleg2_1142 [Rhizobium leguminosarum bv. trifolii WSM2304]
MSENGAKTVGQFPNPSTQFSSEYQPEGRGRPKGSINLQTRIQRLLNGDEALPASIQETIKHAVGEGKQAIDALVIVALLQALQGEKAWADWLANNGFEKPTETTRVQGDEDNPLQVSSKLTVELVRPKESADA